MINNKKYPETFTTEEMIAFDKLRKYVSENMPRALYLVYDKTHIITVVVDECNYFESTLDAFDNYSDPIFSLDLAKIENENIIEGEFYNVRV